MRPQVSLLVFMAAINGCASPAPFVLSGVAPHSATRAWRVAVVRRAGELGYTVYEDAKAVDRMRELGLRTPPGADTTGWVSAEKQHGCGFLSLGCKQYDVLIAVDALERGAGEGGVEIIVYGIKKPLLGGPSVAAPSAAARSNADELLNLIGGLPLSHDQ